MVHEGDLGALHGMLHRIFQDNSKNCTYKPLAANLKLLCSEEDCR